MANDQRARSFGFMLVIITGFILYSGLLLTSNGDINIHAFSNLWIARQELHTELVLFFQEPALKWQRRRHFETKGYSCSRLNHYPNSTSTFQLTRLQTSGDINPNPGPTIFKQQNRKSANNLKIGHLNVRSLKNREHLQLVKHTISQNKFDVLTLSETWLNCSITDLELEIPGYDLYRIDRNTKPGGAVGVYARQTYKVKVLDDISNISDSGLHQLWINLQVRNLKSIVICAMYRPPDTPLTCFDTYLTSSLITASLRNKPIYVLGDGNCDMLKPDCRGAIALTNFCNSFNLSQLVSRPTRVTKPTESLIDVIITSNPQQVIETNVMPSSISDHDLPYVVLRIKKERRKLTYMTGRSFKGYAADRFYKDMSEVPWSLLDIFDDAEDKLYAFNFLFNDILDKHAPIKMMKIRGRPNPYVTEEIRELMRIRDNWKKIAKKSKNSYAWLQYKICCREVKREIRLAEREYVNQQIQNNKNNTNCIWKSLRSCIPKKSTAQRSYSKDHKGVANEFNQFFSSVGENTIKKIKEMAATAECNYTLGRNSFQARIYPTSEQFSFTPVKCHQVEAIIKNMAPNKAPGIDKIPVRIIRDCLQAISYPLTSIINTLLFTACFPNVWKIAEVRPIPKEGDHEIANNNRPISLLPILSKVCERVAHNQLMESLTSKGRLSTKQSGNKEKHCEKTILKNI